MTYSEESTLTSEETIVSPSIKLIDKIVNYRLAHGKPFFSLEFFPPRNEAELNSFWPLMDQLSKGKPLFMDITWHSRASINPDDCLSSLSVASSTIKRFNYETVLHLTCLGYDEITMESILNSVKALGIKNILALRGDPPNHIKETKESKKGKEENQKDLINLINGDSNDYLVKSGQQSLPVNNQQPPPPSPAATTTTTNDQPLVVPINESADDGNKFTCALDLVKFIRKKFNDYFIIGVAGYPMGHPDAKSYQEDLNYLKLKVDAGADFIITQLSFSADHYINFIKDCRTLGIIVPIIPGIFPIQTKLSLRNITKLTSIEPPKEMIEAINSCNNNVKQIQQFGLENVVDLCSKLINSDLDIPGFHFYTLNRDNCVTNILKQLDLWNQITHGNEANQHGTQNEQLMSTIENEEINLTEISTISTCQTNNLPMEPMVS